ncbi:hypothetical protein [Streptomyces fumanus]|uniref:HTH cro/C1-type domain-containing protein n=1 Tax=Streptomyces fumanus TaxID=67302 RepID=A0A919ABP0_9ACTN|nr:hypothetical protein [Streptomyces fumanus]GHE97436.1 hypothetical protein GCM10018772_22060 [Streptomyces fumanus]
MAGRPEAPVDPGAGPVQRLAYELRKLRSEAGGVTYRVLAQRAGYSVTALSQAAAGQRLPTLPVVLAYAVACGGDPVEWEARWKRTVDAVAAASDRAEDGTGTGTVPPYKGLARFEAEDRDRFFGRERLLTEVLELLRGRRLTAVFGASGSGKSSLLRAGVIPALRQSQDAALRPAVIRILTPGEHPARTHARLLAPGEPGSESESGGADTFVVVDQFEEVFTLCQDAGERSRFIDLLLAACHPGSRLRVLLAVRADFYGHCAGHPRLAEALRDAQLLVGPMNAAEVREAIVKPAAAAGLSVERALTSRLVEQVTGAPGGLPLLSHVLLETWRRRRGRVLTLAAYEAAGGLEGAVAQTAEEVYSRLTPVQAAAARRVLLRLVTPGDGTSDTRRPAPYAEVRDAGEAEAAQVVEAFLRARLLTLDEGTIDLAHEALLSAWPRLRAWIEQDRDRLRAHRGLTEAARSWEELDRDPGALYRGIRLAAARDHFGSGRSADLTAAERAFLDASTAAQEKEERAAARTARRLRLFTAALSVLVVLAVTAGLLAWQQSRASDRQRRDADAARRAAVSRELASHSAALIGTNVDLAALLAVQAYRTSPTAQAAQSLYAAAAVPLRRRLTGHQGPVLSVAFRSDGRLVSAADDGTLRQWDASAGQLRRTVPGSAYSAPRFAPNGRLLATAGLGGGVELRDTVTGRVRKRLAVHDPDIMAAAFSPDGRTLATDGRSGTELWDTRTGRRRAALPAPARATRSAASSRPDTGAVLSWGFSPDGRTLATGGNGVELWDARTGRHLRSLPGPVSPVDALAFGPDGRTLATGNDDGVELWDTRTGRRRGALAQYTGPLSSLAFSPDGRTLATGSHDHTVRLWDTGSGRLDSSLTGHTGAVLTLAFSPDGHTLATGGADRTIRLWNMPDSPSRTLLSRHPGQAVTAVFAPGGRTVATSSTGDAAVRLWDTATGRVRAGLRWPGKTDPPAVAAFSPDGRTLATLSAARGIELWDPATGRRRKVLTQYTDKPYALAFSPDGRSLAASSLGRGAQLWDPVTGRLLSSLTASGTAVPALAFSPDGRTLATGGTDGSVTLRDARATSPGRILTGHTGAILALAYSPDGRTLATAGEDRTVRLWDPATGRTRGTLPGHTAPVDALAFSPDGRTLATAGEDHTVRLWDPATGTARLTLSAHTAPVDALAFSPDGRTLATADDHSTIRVWNAALPTPTTAISRICRAVHRDLTAQERTLYLPDHPATPLGEPHCS